MHPAARRRRAGRSGRAGGEAMEVPAIYASRQAGGSRDNRDCTLSHVKARVTDGMNLAPAVAGKLVLMKKLRVGVLFGGRSGEHEISLLSAASVLKAINPEKYEVVPIGITKQGRWVSSTHAEKLLRGEP